MNFENIEENFPTDKIYLNNASVSIMPSSSINNMKDFLLTYDKIGPDSTESEQFIKELWIKTRKTVSELIKCKSDEVVLTQSTTDGINIVANGLKFETDSNVVIRGKNHEHHANQENPRHLVELMKIKKKKGDNLLAHTCNFHSRGPP